MSTKKKQKSLKMNKKTLRVSVIKGTVMQIEKALTNDRLRISKVSCKFHIPTIYNLTVIYWRNLLFS